MSYNYLPVLLLVVVLPLSDKRAVIICWRMSAQMLLGFKHLVAPPRIQKLRSSDGECDFEFLGQRWRGNQAEAEQSEKQVAVKYTSRGSE